MEVRSFPIPWLHRSDDLNWQMIPSANIDLFPWYQTGDKQETRVQVAVSKELLHVLFVCQDQHIYSQITEPNGPVCMDSCVEFFFSPRPEVSPEYFNLEINCCGVIHLGHGPARENRVLAPLQILRDIGVRHTIPGPIREESPNDESWEIEATIPFEALRRMSDFPLPVPGTIWRGNFFRCGGKTDPQYAVWNPIRTPAPDYHRPEYFGELPIHLL